MDDDIQLPPLPPRPPVIDPDVEMRDYARAAVLADRERRAKVDKVPAVHSACVWLYNGSVWLNDWQANKDTHVSITLCWTDDGRAWIDSERNRELAARMRAAAVRGFTSPTYTDLLDVADALDGGVR